MNARGLLATGTGSAAPEALRQAFDLPESAGDAQLARALVKRIVAEDVAKLAHEAAPAPGQQGNLEDESRVMSLRASYLARMPASGRTEALSVDGLQDARALVALLRAGSLAQRRAAIARLGELLRQGAEMPDGVRERALETLIELRPAELAYEATHVLASLQGAEGRAARADQKAWSDLSERVAARVRAYWDGDDHEEPIAALDGEERALLFSRTRDLPDTVLRHVSAVIEDSAGRADRDTARLFVRAVERAADPRLLPALRTVVERQDAELLAPAARSLGATADPRAHGLLKDAYERASRTNERLVLAAALGTVGDARGLDYVRDVWRAGDQTMLVPVLEALAELGSTDDVQRICELVEASATGDDQVLRAAVTTLGRIADSRALVPLARLYERTERSALRGEIEEAQAAIHARMELLGEEAAPAQTAVVTWDTTKVAALARKSDPALLRLRAYANLILGYLWRSVGAHTRAIARLEAAATLRTGWVEPVLAVALLRGRSGETSQALAAFRRAVQIDRAYVESHGFAITAMAQAFLRRAEAMEREGRIEIARGLTEEIHGFDLRRASERVRAALRERSARSTTHTGGAR